MKKHSCYLLLLTGLSCLPLYAQATVNVSTLPELREADFIHPGMLHNQAELDFVKEKVQAKEKPWIDSWNQLLKTDISSLDYESKAIEKVYRGPYEKPDIGAGDMERASGAAYSQAIQWIVTGDSVHALKAIEIFNDYAYTLKFIGDNDAKLLVGMTGTMMLNAAEIIKHTSSFWTEPDLQQFEKMIREVYYETIKDWFPRANGNWDASMIQTMLCIAVFFDDSTLFNKTVDYFMNGETKGNILWYINGETGQCQETGRDQHHTFMGLGFLGAACEIGWKQGVDMYSAYDNRLALGFEYTAKYNLGFDVPFESYKTYDGRIVNNKISRRGRGSFYPMWEKVYHHYHDRMGMEMPYTKQVLDKVRPQKWYIKFPVGQSLMYQNLPVYPKGYVEDLGTNNKVTQIGQVKVKSSAQTTVNVSTLQELREAVQKSDQTIVMKSGSYKLTDLPDGSRNFPCSGSNNMIDLSGIYVNVPVGTTRRSYITISGNNNILRGGTFEDTYQSGLKEVTDFSSYNQNRSTLARGLRGSAVLGVTGDNNRVVSTKLTIRGSFPYGYGSIYGIGSDNVYGLDKRCGIVIKGQSNTIDGCELQQRAFGHGIYMQSPANKTMIKNTLVEGRMRPSKDLYLETDPKDLPARSNYKLPRSGNKPIPKDVMLPLSEDGIRVYTRGGSVTVENCIVKKMRGGIRLYLASSATVTNSTAIDCGSTNFNLPGGGKITGSGGNFAYAPLSDFRLSKSKQDIELTILPSPNAVGSHNVADILGSNHNIIFHRSEGPIDTDLRPIVVTGDNSTIRNETEYPIILQSSASGNTVVSFGKVTDFGTNNKISHVE